MTSRSNSAPSPRRLGALHSSGSKCIKALNLFSSCGCRVESVVTHGNRCPFGGWNPRPNHIKRCVNSEIIWRIRNGPDGTCLLCIRHIKTESGSPFQTTVSKSHRSAIPSTKIKTRFPEQIAFQKDAKEDEVEARHREVCLAFWTHASRLWTLGELELENPKILWEESLNSRLYCCEIEARGKGQVSLLTRSWEQKTFSKPLSNRLILGTAKNEPQEKVKASTVRRQYKCATCQDFPIPEGCGECI